MLKRYYKLQLLQTSPLHLSNGDSQESDSDLLKDSRGLPFIPGTALIGAMRDLLENEDDKCKLFGWIKGGQQQASRVIGSDAVLPENACQEDLRITFRDGVCLDTFWGTPQKSAKYDMEIVETDLPYSAILEWTGKKEDKSLGILSGLISQIVATGLHLGGKVTRGYGAMKVSAWKIDFDFPDALKTWLDFDPRKETEAGWTPLKTKTGLEAVETEKGQGPAVTEIDNNPVKTLFTSGKYLEYNISFRIEGSIAVRVYSAEPQKADYAPLMSRSGKPVIPGTSWAGAFRHRMHQIARELSLGPETLDEIDAFFGKLKDGMKQSPIRFSESEIQEGKPREITRNALDRFTSGPAMSALFSAGYWYGGNGNVRISILREECSPLMKQLLLASIRDMNLGLMTIGGNASTGSGQLRITKITADGKPIELEVENNE